MTGKKVLVLLLAVLVVGIIGVTFPGGDVVDNDQTPATANENVSHPGVEASADVIAHGVGEVPPMSTVATLHLGIGSCWCSSYTQFDITWSDEDSSLVNSSALADLLIASDKDGALLCDCENSDSTYKSIIKSVSPLEDAHGLRVTLSREVHLTLSGVASNFREVLEPKKTAVFNGHDFQVT